MHSGDHGFVLAMNAHHGQNFTVYASNGTSEDICLLNLDWRAVSLTMTSGYRRHCQLSLV